jgi:hypothetical protein
MTVGEKARKYVADNLALADEDTLEVGLDPADQRLDVRSPNVSTVSSPRGTRDSSRIESLSL